MKPVVQTILDAPHGNCYAACIASIFELAIDDVPNVCEKAGGEWGKFNAWLRGLGLENNWIEEGMDGVPEWPPAWRPTGYWIAVQPSPRGVNHATVWNGKRLMWDPHPQAKPGGEGLGEVVSIEWFYVRDPAKLARGLTRRWASYDQP